MKKIITAACLAGSVLLGSLVVAPTAEAAQTSPGCVTRAEYNKAKKGMKQSKVHKIFGTKGKREARASSSGYVSEIRTYTVCNSEWSTIAIAFDKKPRKAMRLSAKNAVWVD